MQGWPVVLTIAVLIEQRVVNQTNTRSASCPFCGVDASGIIWSSTSTISLWDAFPVSPGHALIVPRRHVVSWAELTAEEKADLSRGIDALRNLIDQRYRPDGYNVGFNDGVAAGQTVMHFHLHVIPRYQGDVSDPRGGIRWVLGERAAYWHEAERSKPR